jgi:hypothetical protein
VQGGFWIFLVIVSGGSAIQLLSSIFHERVRQEAARIVEREFYTEFPDDCLVCVAHQNGDHTTQTLRVEAPMR